MAENLAILADPTNFGNAPGDGPLRAGGMPGEPEKDSDLPSTRSKQSEQQQAALQIVRDLWEGTSRLRARGEVYLPRAPGETLPHYRNRLSRSAFFNALQRTVEGLSGLIHRKDPELGEDVPAQIRGHWENIDLAGTHGDVFVRELTDDVLQAGHAAILVEFPPTGGEQDARAEMLGEVRPYWVPIKKEDIMSWRVSVRDGHNVLEQLVIRESSFVPDGRFGEKEQERYRVLFLAPEGPGWALLEIAENRSVVVVDEGMYTNQDAIPVAEIKSSGRKSMFVSQPPLLDLAHLNVAHYQMWSDYNWSIHKTCVPLLFGAGIDARDPQTGKTVQIQAGANTAIMQLNADAKLAYVSHSGEALGNVKDALDDLKSEMGTLGLAMLSPQKRMAETAEAKRLDKSTSDSALAVTARGIQDGLERALDFHAKYLGIADGGSIEVNRDFEGLLMEAPVMQAFATLVNAGFPPRPVLEALQAGGRIPEDADLDELEMEWLMGSAQQAELAAPAPNEPRREPASISFERDPQTQRVVRLVRG